MTHCATCGAELEPPVRAPHTVYVKTLYRIAVPGLLPALHHQSGRGRRRHRRGQASLGNGPDPDGFLELFSPSFSGRTVLSIYLTAVPSIVTVYACRQFR